jgi:hypothetical protein
MPGMVKSTGLGVCGTEPVTSLGLSLNSEDTFSYLTNS